MTDPRKVNAKPRGEEKSSRLRQDEKKAEDLTPAC
jgi:hypothetical protein